PRSYLHARALRLGKDVRRAVGAVKALACGFPDAESLLGRVRRYARTESGNTSRV
ncbi:MAG: hypothetical protein H6Q85_2677, partial [candidate division NC10 bacterium]|nr:hypothetical protein [candidate division NC10 bacterium]